jgi:hypothetical protein
VVQQGHPREVFFIIWLYAEVFFGSAVSKRLYADRCLGSLVLEGSCAS